MKEQHPRDREVIHRLPRVAAIIVLLGIPAIVAQQIWLPSTAGVFILGSLPAIIAVVAVGPRRAWQIAIAAAGAGFLAATFIDKPWVGALIVALLAAYGGYSARYGNESPVLFVPIVVSFIVIAPPDLKDSAGASLEGWVFASAIGLSLLIGGCWSALLGSVLARNLTRAPSEPVDRSTAIGYAIALGTSTGLATFIAAFWFPGSTGAWAVLTILLVMKPRATDMWRTARHRVGGTIAGAVVAAATVLVLSALTDERQQYELLIGAVFLIFALSVMVVRPYWYFVTLFTPAIIFLKSSGNDALNLDIQRVALTIVGTLVAIVFAVAVRESHRLLTQQRTAA